MVVSRILSRPALLDKLPSWLALPASALIGAFLGYSASIPDADPGRLVLVGVAFAAVIAWGMGAPRPTRRDPGDSSGAPHDNRSPDTSPPNALPADDDLFN